jgi:hypothetical protein
MFLVALNLELFGDNWQGRVVANSWVVDNLE